MIRAEYKDKNRIIKILTKSFDKNESVNFVIKQDKKRVQRLQALMCYSFEMCFLFGDVYLSNDRNGCALVLYPDKKKITLKTVLLNLQLIFSCIGISNIKKAISRESKIKQVQPKVQMYYLWFIGVRTEYQLQGVGSKFMNDIIKDSDNKNKSIYLETSTLKNISWYKKFGFHIYNEIDIGYKLFFLKKE